MFSRGGAWKIASIRGVDLKVHVSLIFLLFYVILIASMQFRLVAARAGIDPVLLTYHPLIWGVLFALGLLASVAIHEYGHVFVALAQGVKVRGVTLMMLGGASEMERMPERPFAEFKLSIIGPIVSLSLGGLLLLIHSGTSSPNLALYTFWLGTANLTLGIFNLLPAFPLDGGRALRSLLAVRRGTFRATQIAVQVSQTFAWILGALGLFSFNLLLILIAFFIHTIAQAELGMLTMRHLLEGVQVSEVFYRLAPVDERATLQEAADRMLDRKTPVLPVNTLQGESALISLESLRGIPREDLSRRLVADSMERVSKALTLEESLSDAIPDLMTTSTNALPVREGSQVIGVVRKSDVDQLVQLLTIRGPGADRGMSLRPA